MRTSFGAGVRFGTTSKSRRAARRPFRKNSIGFLVADLEARVCPSVFYDFDVIAQTSSVLTGIQPAASINDSGDVAFVASTNAGQSIYAARGTSAPQIISFAN